MMRWINLSMVILECLTLIWSQYRFLSHNGRTIVLQKRWYILMFAVEYLLMFLPGSGLFTGIAMQVASAATVMLGPVVLGAAGFHRKKKALIFDLLYGGFLLVMLQVGIMAGYWLGIRFQLSSVETGSLMMALKCLVVLTGTAVVTAFMRKKLTGKISGKQLAAMVLLPCFSLFYIWSLGEMNQFYLVFYGPGLMAVNVAVLLLMDLYIFYLLQYQFKTGRLEQELAVFQQENQLRYRYYEELEGKYRESRKILHDMKNHLQAVEELYAGQDVQAGESYVKDLYHMMNVLSEQQYTPNRMLNIILNEKMRLAREKGIRASVKIGDADLSDMKDLDITTVFANLLDNALEAAEMTGKESSLSVKLDQVRDFRVGEIANSWEPEKEKSRKGHMGLGLENVRNTLEKYHGTLQTESGNGMYRVRFMIPGGGT